MFLKILITGGNGFIARNLFEQLKRTGFKTSSSEGPAIHTNFAEVGKNFSAYLPNSPDGTVGVKQVGVLEKLTSPQNSQPSKYTILSLNSRELNLLDSQKVFNYIKNNKFDVVIHTANHDAAARFSTKDPQKVLENNLRMFFNIARCKEHFSKMIYFGSGAEFDRRHWLPKMKEDYFNTYVPADQYGFSKYIMTKYAEVNSNIYNLRLFGVFGKYDDWKTRFLPNACSSAVLNRDIRMNQNRSFDFLYIDDLVKIVRWFIDNKPKKNVYNICTGKTIDFKSIAEKIIKISGKKNLKIRVKLKGSGREYSGDNTRLMKEIKGFKFTSINQSIKVLYEWYEKNKQIIKKPF
jgi:UDP-glucose 4-epimerase